MTMTEHRETDWRKLIAEVRTVYDGPVGYNCDKYGEDHITWWEAVDVIASSGYYPIDDWENQLDRIEEVVKNTRSLLFLGGWMHEYSWFRAGAE